MKNIFKSKGKRGLAPLFIVLFIVLALIFIYCLLFLPIPAFTKLRMIINYFLIIILFLIIQVGFIYGYIKLGTFASRGIIKLKNKVMNWSLNLKNYIIIHS